MVIYRIAERRRSGEEEAVTASQLMGIGAGILLVAFIVFTFRQGLQVKPNKDAKDNWSFGGAPHDNPSS